MKRALALAAVLLFAGSASGAERSGIRAPSFAPATSYRTGEEPVSIAVGDLNGDGKLDLATGNGGSVSVLLNEGNGHFEPKRSYVPGADSVAVGDLNGDGKLDLVAGREDTISVLLNRGDGRFLAKRDYKTRASSSSVALGDLNGDGALDVVSGGVSVLLNRGDGSLQTKLVYRAQGESAVAIGDLNADGKLDLVVHGYSNVSVLLNRGGATFRARRVYKTGDADIPASAAIGDVNGDRRPDLATANDYADSVSLLLNKGSGRFGAKHDYKAPVNSSPQRGGGDPFSVAIADLNRDGRPDIATANAATVEPGTVSVFVNEGRGRFRPVLYGTGGPYSVSVAIGDLNGDGKPDMVAANHDADTVSVFLNRPGLCTVQGVWRQPLSVAKRRLVLANCRVGAIRRVTSGVKAGSVVRQKPAFGAVLPGGSKVDLVVSRGRKRS